MHTKMEDESTISKQDLIALVTKAIALLSVNPKNAIKLLHPYSPANGPVSVDYGIYTLQYALLFGEDIQKTYADENKSLPVKIGRLFEKCKTKNFDEYIKLLKWIAKEMKQVHEQMKRARVNLSMDSALYESLGALSTINPSEVEKLVLSLEINNPRHHLLANTYKDLYEISFFLELLANLIIISGGKKFSAKPFKDLKIDGRAITGEAGRLVKGNAINWLEKNPDTFLSTIIKSSYDNTLRNLLGGHNDYVFDSSSEIYRSKDGKVKFEYARVLTCLSNLELLISALRLDGLTRYFEDVKHPIKISEIGFIHMHPAKKKDTLIIAQYWSNFNRRTREDLPKIISFHEPLVKTINKYICLSFNKKFIFPYDFTFGVTDFSLSLMKSLLKKDKINIIVCAVAPKVSPFTYISKSTIIIDHKEFLVTNSLEAEVEIDKPNLEKLIEYLEN